MRKKRYFEQKHSLCNIYQWSYSLLLCVCVFFHVSLPPTIISATFIYLHIHTWWIPGTFLDCFNIYTFCKKKSLTLEVGSIVNLVFSIPILYINSPETRSKLKHSFFSHQTATGCECIKSIIVFELIGLDKNIEFSLNKYWILHFYWFDRT